MTPPVVLVAEDSLVIRAVLSSTPVPRLPVIEAGDGERALAASPASSPTSWLLDVADAPPGRPRRAGPGSRPTRALPTSRLCS